MTFLRFLPFIHHTVVCSFRQALGRWYIFRDRPTWYVAEIAYLGKEEPSLADKDPDDVERILSFVDQARSELMLRHRQESRTQA